jgi:hypothetical protein
MCIRKEGSLYRVGSKFYTQDEFLQRAIAFVGGLFVLALLMWVVIDTISLNKILASDDPAANLSIALDRRPTWTRARMALDEIGDPLLLTLAPACEGQAVGGTIYQDEQPGPHPLVFLLPGGKSHRLTYYYLKQWGPESRQAEDVQVVVCAVEIEDKIEVCEYGQYGGASRTRIQHKINLNIVEAATGRTYAYQVFEGSVPGKCPGTVSGEHKEIRGDEVETSKISEYLNELFE